MNDFRFALRQIGKSPGFTATVLLTLAIGIGACTAIFSVVNSVLLRPLAYEEAERLVVLHETKFPQFPTFPVSPANYADWREQAKSFEQLAAVRDTTYNLTGEIEPIRVIAERVTPNYLSTLRVRPMLGRDFTAEDAKEKNDLVILTYGFWQHHLGGRAEIVGQNLRLNGRSFSIIGVMPENFQRGSVSQILTPADYTEDNEIRGAHSLRVFGRIKPGASLQQAQSELSSIAATLAHLHPDTNKGWGVNVTPLFEATVGDVRPVLFSLLGAAGFLLLIASANIANLLLARATSRTKEIALRTTLGANRSRIIRQLLGEGLLLALLGGALGLLIAEWGLSALLYFAPSSLPRVTEITLDVHAFIFACILVLLTGVGFSFMPMLLAARVSLTETLKDGGRGKSQSRRSTNLRGSLVIAEVALALILSLGAGLLIRSFAALQKVNPGFQPNDAISVSLNLPAGKYGSAPQQAAFVEETLARLASLRGVESVGLTNVLPFSGDDFNLAFKIVNHPPTSPGEMPSTLYYSVTPDYFKAMGIRLLRGRLFSRTDGADRPRVALINESMAKKYFAGENPIGQRIRVTNADSEIVGIVADVRHRDLGVEAQAQTYEPFAQLPFNFMTFVVRISPATPGANLSSSALSRISTEIKNAIYSVDKNQPIASIRPLTDLVAASIARLHFAMFLFGVFSIVALLLSAIGIYGVMAYSVARRTGEFGIRMAIGAQQSDVLILVLSQGGRLVAFGLLLGGVAALGLTRFIASMLFGISEYDPLTFIAIAALLTVVAAFACWLPARSATKVDPMVALRVE